MDNFPPIYRHGTLVHNPVVGAMESGMANDPTIRSQIEGGYVKSRARFTRIPRQWTIRYEWMSAVNKGTIRAFEDARYAGADSFTWTNPDPEDSTSYTVRFLEPIKYTPHPNANFLWWMVEFILEEV